MMDDHETLCRARNELVAALAGLLKVKIMNADDFNKSREHAVKAVAAIDVLLRQPHGN
jgi:hypothetical protein